MAVTLIFSGFVKAVDPLGTQYKLTDYLGALNWGGQLPDAVLLGFAVLLSVIEFVLGICLLFAIRRRLVSRLTLLMMVIMTPLTLWLALTDPISDCGCFGDAVVLTNWQTFGKNVVLLLIAIVLWKWPLDMVRFVSRSNQWIVVNFSILFIAILSAWSLYDLPYFDFRPYHVGTDLRSGWQRMMEDEESSYSDFFVERVTLKGDGDQMEQVDSEDITEAVLNYQGYTFLLVSPHLEQANDSQLDLINQVYEYAEDERYPFYCLTASGQKGISRWIDRTGAEYPFCQTDDIVLKTIVRSNPGLLLLKDGKIIRKWSHNRLPDEYQLNGRLERLDIGKMPDDSVPQKILFILLWYVLPLAVLTIADRLWAWTKWVRKHPAPETTEVPEAIVAPETIDYSNPKNKRKHEKEDCSRQLENEPDPAGRPHTGQGTE